MLHKYCILLTATIDPGNTPKVTRSNIHSRESDYVKALQFYLSLGYPVIFCENSNYDSKKINQIIYQNNNVEYLKYKSKLSSLGKGHGEKEIIDYVYANSKFITDSEYVVKITGRLIVKNINQILYKLNISNFYLSVNLVRNLVFTDSRFFIFHTDFYNSYFKHTLSNYLDEQKGIVFEICLARAYHFAMSEGRECVLLPNYPTYKGYNAWNNRKLSRGVYYRLKYKIYYWVKLYVIRQTI